MRPDHPAAIVPCDRQCLILTGLQHCCSRYISGIPGMYGGVGWCVCCFQQPGHLDSGWVRVDALLSARCTHMCVVLFCSICCAEGQAAHCCHSHAMSATGLYTVCVQGKCLHLHSTRPSPCKIAHLVGPPALSVVSAYPPPDHDGRRDVSLYAAGWFANHLPLPGTANASCPHAPAPGRACLGACKPIWGFTADQLAAHTGPPGGCSSSCSPHTLPARPLTCALRRLEVGTLPPALSPASGEVWSPSRRRQSRSGSSSSGLRRACGVASMEGSGGRRGGGVAYG